MRTFRRSAVALIAGVGVALSLAACSDSSDSSDGESDDTLVIYSGRGEELISPLIEKFETETGIDTDVRYAGSAEQAQLILTEGDKTPAEVFLSQEAGALGLIGGAGLLAELPDEVLSKVPEAYTADDDTWVGVTGRARVVVYDSEKVSEQDAPKTAAQMIDPKWRGQIGIAPGNASFISFVTAMRLVDGDEATEKWLRALADNDPVIFDNNRKILDAVNTGEIEIGLINHYYWFSAAAEQGAENMRAKLQFGEPGDVAGLVNATGVGVLESASDDPDARAFVDFLLSEQGQTYFAEEEFEYPLVPGIAGPEGVPALDSLRGPDIDLSDLGTVEESAQLIDEAGLSVG